VFKGPERLGSVPSLMSAQPRKQGFKALAVFLAYGEESQAKPAATFYVADDGVGPDATFLDQEIKFGRHALFHFEVRGLDEQAVDADVEDAGDVVPSVAAPTDPNIVGG
jgi:hypothetical protein